MIEQIVSEMIDTILILQNSIKEDIEDVKQANHENLLNRNDLKRELMLKISEQKQQLNKDLAEALRSGVDVNIYRGQINNLEDQLRNLYVLNGKLAAIILPVKEMYKEIVDELTAQSGGSLIDIRA